MITHLSLKSNLYFNGCSILVMIARPPFIPPWNLAFDLDTIPYLAVCLSIYHSVSLPIYHLSIFLFPSLPFYYPQVYHSFSHLDSRKSLNRSGQLLFINSEIQTM